jgi:hypothetical protein
LSSVRPVLAEPDAWVNRIRSRDVLTAPKVTRL